MRAGPSRRAAVSLTVLLSLGAASCGVGGRPEAVPESAGVREAPGGEGRRSAMSVKTLLADSSSAHGRVVTLRGVIRFDHGLASIYSRSGKACVGLLASKDQLTDFARWNGRKVATTGTVDSEGCTSNSICDEHLCGPAILTDVSVRPL